MQRQMTGDDGSGIVITASLTGMGLIFAAKVRQVAFRQGKALPEPQLFFLNYKNNRRMNNNEKFVNPNPDRTSDVHDSQRDEERLKSETSYIELPDVDDIPGQEFVHVPNLGEMADTTISSEDEEADYLWAESNDTEVKDELTNGDNNDISPEEKDTLERTFGDLPTQDNANLRHATVDEYDNEGEPLNEASTDALSGHDLDTTIVDADDAMENIGEEDEENNIYSIGGQDNLGRDLEGSTNG
jgi:hypothetical protein